MPQKGFYSKLTPLDWIKIKAAYESDPSQPTLETLGKLYHVHFTTISKHAKAQGWIRNNQLALDTIKRVKADSDAVLDQTSASVTQQLAKHLSDTLQPWIEREKSKHLRSQIKRSKLALRQLDNHIDANLTLSPKDSSFVAKSAETWDNIMRKSLGLNDSGVIPGSLTLNVLTDHAAVQVKSTTDK